MTNGRSRRFLAGVAAFVSTVAVAAAWAPPAFADRRGNSAVDAALAAERAQQAAAAGTNTTPTTAATATRPAPAPVPTPFTPAKPATPAPAAPTAAAAAIAGTLDVGSSGDQVTMVEQRLAALHYFVGAVNSTYDDDTYQAVMAFQKTNNMDRTGTVNQAVWSAMTTAKDPAPLVPGGGGHRVEVDLARQVLFLYEGGSLSKIIAISSGTDATPTPTGDFAVYYQTVGWETSALGQLYNSQYFTGGYAIHGSRSVPAQPASHGCVRIPMTAADWFPDHVNIGTPVFVR